MDIKLFDENTKWLDHSELNSHRNKLTMQMNVALFCAKDLSADGGEDWVTIAESSGYILLSPLNEVITFMS